MRNRITLSGLGVLLALGTGACQSNTTSNAEDAPVRSEAAASGPIGVGERVGDATLTSPDGREVQLASLYAEGPVVVTFFRGGWCPYCVRALTEWQGREDELREAGARLVAVSLETHSAAGESAEKSRASYIVLSDAELEAARAFRVLFTLDDATQRAYKGYGVDLASRNASGTWQLPIPGAFVIDTDGIVRWASANEDYTTRASPDDVIAAVRALR